MAAAPLDRIDRAPPHDLEAEIAVLGSMLLDNEVIGEVATLVRADDFYRDAHRRLFEAMIGLYDSGKGCDAVTLREDLQHRGVLDAVGGSDALVTIMDRVPTAAHAVHYSRIVRDTALRRGVIGACDRVLRSAHDGARQGREILDEAEAAFFQLDRESETGEISRIGDVLKHVFQQIDKYQEREGRLTGLGTGFYDLDDMTGGLHTSEMVVVAARPSMGKTSLALCIAEHAAVVEGKPVALFSLEMARAQVVQNMLCSRAKVDGVRLRRGFLADEDFSKLSGAVGKLSEARIFIDDTPSLTPLALRAKARRLKAREEIALVIVDYLQLMEAGVGSRSESRQQEISLISRSIKALARELQVPIIAVSQLNRAVDAREDHRPRMSDLRESGAIEQDADVVLLLHREEYYIHDPKRKAEEAGQAELIVAKQRNGPTGVVPLTFLAPYMRFESGARQRV